VTVASARPRLIGDRSDAFETWHREELPRDCRVMDGDLIYATQDGTVYLLGEVITIRAGTLEAADTEKYEIWDFKRNVLKDLSERLGVPAVVVWATEKDDEVMVKNLRTEKVRRVGADGYAELLRLFRDRHGGEL